MSAQPLISPFLFAALLDIDATPRVIEVRLPRYSGVACIRAPGVDIAVPSQPLSNPNPIKRSKRSAAAEKRRAQKRRRAKR